MNHIKDYDDENDDLDHDGENDNDGDGDDNDNEDYSNNGDGSGNGDDLFGNEFSNDEFMERTEEDNDVLSRDYEDNSN